MREIRFCHKIDYSEALFTSRKIGRTGCPYTVFEIATYRARDQRSFAKHLASQARSDPIGGMPATKVKNSSVAGAAGTSSRQHHSHSTTVSRR
jgi:hypothetical protein